MIMENWKVINQFPDYEVSDHGQVRRIDNGELLKGSLVDGYRRVKLTNKLIFNKSKDKRINLLVGEHFVHNPDPINLTQVHHIDKDRLNNIYTNLMWVTNDDNNKSENKTKRSKIRSPFIKTEVIEILSAKGVTPDSQLAIKYNCGVKAIHGIWSGKYKKANEIRIVYLVDNPNRMHLYSINQDDLDTIDAISRGRTANELLRNAGFI